MTNNADRLTVSEARLRDMCQRLLVALGVADEDAAVCLDVFLQAELMGEESHGLRLFLHVLGRLRAGGDRADTRVDIVTDRGAMAVLEANRSLGQVVAAQAMRMAMDKAADFGIGFVGVRNSNSYTSAKYYPLLAVERGMIGITYTNTSRKLMPPEGGRTPILGNNPMALSAPAGRHPPFVLDMACTRAAVERIVQAKEQGERIPEGWALDREGHPTTDPAEALASSALLPFGGYKAFGLAVGHEILTSVLFGGALFAGESSGFLPYEGAMNTSYSFMAIDVAAFMPLEVFRDRMDQVIDRIKSSELRPDASPIRVPGERAFAEMSRRRDDGVPVKKLTLDRLTEWCIKLGVDG